MINEVALFVLQETVYFLFQIQLTYNLILVSGVQHSDIYVSLYKLQSDHLTKSSIHITLLQYY